MVLLQTVDIATNSWPEWKLKLLPEDLYKNILNEKIKLECGFDTVNHVLYNEIRHNRMYLPADQISILQCIKNRKKCDIEFNNNLWQKYINKTGIFEHLNTDSFNNFRKSKMIDTYLCSPSEEFYIYPHQQTSSVISTI